MSSRARAAPLARPSGLEETCFLLAALYDVLRCLPPAELMDAQGKAYKQWAKAVAAGKADNAQVPQTLMTLSTHAQRQQWRTQFQALPLAITTDALLLADLFDAIDGACADRPSAGNET